MKNKTRQPQPVWLIVSLCTGIFTVFILLWFLPNKLVFDYGEIEEANLVVIEHAKNDKVRVRLNYDKGNSSKEMLISKKMFAKEIDGRQKASLRWIRIFGFDKIYLEKTQKIPISWFGLILVLFLSIMSTIYFFLLYQNKGNIPGFFEQ